jgi:hypothetical protein
VNEYEERRVLEMLSAPIEHDLRLADPDADIEWVAEEGEWWYRCSVRWPRSIRSA